MTEGNPLQLLVDSADDDGHKQGSSWGHRQNLHRDGGEGARLVVVVVDRDGSGGRVEQEEGQDSEQVQEEDQ